MVAGQGGFWRDWCGAIGRVDGRIHLEFGVGATNQPTRISAECHAPHVDMGGAGGIVDGGGGVDFRLQRHGNARNGAVSLMG